MIVCGLISLCEGVVICDARVVVSVAAKVCLGSLLLLDGHGHNLDLVVGEANLHLKLVRHHKFICLDRIIVVLLLLLLLLLLLVLLLELLLLLSSLFRSHHESILTHDHLLLLKKRKGANY